MLKQLNIIINVFLQPNYAIAYYNMGNIFKEQSNFDEAIKLYKKAISFKPDYSEAYSNLGLTLQDQGMLEEAITAYRKSLSLNPILLNLTLIWA